MHCKILYSRNVLQFTILRKFVESVRIAPYCTTRIKCRISVTLVIGRTMQLYSYLFYAYAQTNTIYFVHVIMWKYQSQMLHVCVKLNAGWPGASRKLLFSIYIH